MEMKMNHQRANLQSKTHPGKIEEKGKGSYGGER